MQRRCWMAPPRSPPAVREFSRPRGAAAPEKITPALIEAAKKEGKVVYYTSIEVQVAEKVGKAFEAKFPACPSRSNGPAPSACSSASARNSPARSTPPT